MNHQESIQLLEEMGLDRNSRCPSCNEILIKKIKKVKTRDGNQTVYKCSHCNQYFRIMICNICHKLKYSYKLNICYDCFKKAKLPQLITIQERLSKDYKKIMLLTARKKPDIIVSIPKNIYNKIALKAIDLKISKSELCLKAINKFIVTDV